MKVTIIGSGPGGMSAAKKAAELGAEVLVIEKDKIGGVCLNEGCIPTKKFLAQVQKGVTDRTQNWLAALTEKESLIRNQQKEIQRTFRGHGIKLVEGKATLKSPKTILVEKNDGKFQLIKADRIIIATGSSPAPLSSLDYTRPEILGTCEALNLKKLPKKLVIVGGGVSGLEFATIFRGFGVKVTILEITQSLLPGEDERIVAEITQTLETQGVEILTGKTCENLQAEKILVTAGRRSNSENLGLENTGVQTNQKGAILVDEKMETNVKGIYAIGDVACPELIEGVGKFFLAHVASREGEIAAENAMGLDSKMDYRAIPRVIYTIPQIATVGFTAEEAERNRWQVTVGRAYFKANAMAQITEKTEGFVQIVTDAKDGKILGAQIIGYEASILIQEIVLAIKIGASLEKLAETCHPHPTFSEIIQEAARNALKGR